MAGAGSHLRIARRVAELVDRLLRGLGQLAESGLKLGAGLLLAELLAERSDVVLEARPGCLWVWL